MAETRRYLGVETPRQWTDKAIAHTAVAGPVFPHLFDGHQWRDCGPNLPRSTAWRIKPQATCSDGLALVRRTIWADRNCVNSPLRYRPHSQSGLGALTGSTRSHRLKWPKSR